jgi:hypothetical protein
MNCADFDAAADELAVEGVDEPRRSELLAHAAGCARCEAQLDELAAVADRMLLLAPAVEPPPGFESRALARMDGAARPRRWRPSKAAAWVVVMALAAGVVVGRVGSSSDDSRQATIISASGTTVGTVELDPSPKPHVLVTVDGPGRSSGVRSCELVLPDGRGVVVGSWTYDEVKAGSWSVGIEESLLRASTMRILADDGRVVATATF